MRNALLSAQNISTPPHPPPPNKYTFYDPTGPWTSPYGFIPLHYFMRQKKSAIARPGGSTPTVLQHLSGLAMDH